MKSFMRFSFLILLGLSTLFYSCSEETDTENYNLDFGYDYYPLEVGKYHVYQVDSTTFNIVGNDVVEKLESTTFAKEELTGIFLDNEGDTTYIIERFEKKDLAHEWVIRDVWSTKTTENRVERTEENLKLIKLIFPLRAGSDFDATLFVDEETMISVAGETLEIFKNWNAEVISVDELESIGTFDFPNVATISYADDENLIEKRFAMSKYAKGVGMVYREDWILDTQIFDETAPWDEKAEKGYILKQTLLEYN